MKLRYILALTFSIVIGLSCEKKMENPTNCLKGKLVLKGICKNYVIQFLEGEINANMVEQKWINPETKVQYSNVFGLASICTFPETIAEGQEFYFSVLDQAESATCVQCKAYAPVPDKKLHISICSVN